MTPRFFQRLAILAAVSAGLFSAPAVSGEAVRFFAFGDWGKGNAAQREVAVQVKRVCRSSGCDFGLSLGDNFYPLGVKDIRNKQFREKFEDVYRLEQPFYVALGNHDVEGDIQAQLDYSKVNPLWILPDRQYSFVFPRSGPPLLEIFVMDSNRVDAAALGWLKQALGASRAAWKFLVLHHPILNNGTKHPADEKKVYAGLKPLICGKIDFVLSGHEHIFSHLKDTKDACGWEQIILGTGGAKLFGISSHPPAQYKVFAAEDVHGLGYFIVDDDVLKFEFIRADGSVGYKTEWKKSGGK